MTANAPAAVRSSAKTHPGYYTLETTDGTRFVLAVGRLTVVTG